MDRPRTSQHVARNHERTGSEPLTLRFIDYRCLPDLLRHLLALPHDLLTFMFRRQNKLFTQCIRWITVRTYRVFVRVLVDLKRNAVNGT